MAAEVYSNSPDLSASFKSSDRETVQLAIGEGRTSAHSETSSSSYTKRELLFLISCLSAQFLSNVCQSLPAPFLPLLNENHNVESGVTGWVLGLLPLVQVFMSPVYGKSMAYVSPKTMLVSGLFILGIFTVLFGFLEYIPLPETSTSIQTVFLLLEIFIRMLQACGSTAVVISAMTLLTLKFSAKSSTILGYSSTAMGLGFMCGPAIGSGLYAIGGFIMVFASIGAILLIQSVMLIFFLQKNEISQSAESARDQPSVTQLLKSPRRLAYLALSAFVGVLWSSIEPIIEPELRQKYGLSEEISALTFLLASFTYTISSPLVGKALDSLSWLNARHLMVFGFVLHSINFFFMGPSPLLVLSGFTRPLWLLLLCLAVLGSGVAIGFVASMDEVVSIKSSDSEFEDNPALLKNTKAAVAGFWASAYAFGAFLGATLSGLVNAYTSFGVTITCYSIACGLAAALLVIVHSCKFLIRSQNNEPTNEEIQPLLRAS
ncbi:MFS-type transporter SLC18B1-like [Watersipora subatra]|uniref:MFS-type transporter SLC18B1-like n=1 Tax=Watersipora subatra TaxID=2589382 RepID=UPI00355B50E2